MDLRGAYTGKTAFAGLWLDGSTIRGNLQAPEVILPTNKYRAGELPRLSLTARLPDIKQGERDVEQRAPVSMTNCHVAGDCTLLLNASELWATGAILGGNFDLAGNLQKLIANGIGVGRDMTVGLDQNDLTGYTDELQECNLGGAVIRGTFDMKATSSHIKVLSLRDAEIGHSLVIAPLYTKFWRLRRSKLICYPEFTLNEIEILENQEAGTKHSAATFLTSKKHKRILLDGRSTRLHELNKETETRFHLTSEEAAQDYLRLFCAYVWAEYGAFTLIEEESQLPLAYHDKVQTRRVLLSTGKQHEMDKFYFLDAMVRYAGVLYNAVFKVDATTGMVEMLDDNPCRVDGVPVAYEWNELPKYNSPLRVLQDWNDWNHPDFAPVGSPEKDDVARKEFLQEVPQWSEDITRHRFLDARIDFRQAHCGILNDNSGRAWSEASDLWLDEFKYRETFLPRSAPGYEVDDEIEYRKKMLSEGTDFRAQPYAHLAKVMRDRGDDDAAQKIEAQGIRLGAEDRAKPKPGEEWKLGDIWKLAVKGRLKEAWVLVEKLKLEAKFLLYFWWKPYGIFFNYGLGVGRALVTLVGFLLIGWLAITMLSENRYLNANITKVASAAIQDPPVANAAPIAKAVLPAPLGTSVEAIPCGDSIAPVLYAAELMTPILNFHQASRCEIREYKPDDETKTLDIKGHVVPHWMYPKLLFYPKTWEYLEGLYIVLGSLITSLALLTFSGIARRWEH